MRAFAAQGVAGLAEGGCYGAEAPVGGRNSRVFISLAARRSRAGPLLVDCRKVDKIDFLPSGDMVMHVGWIEVVVPRNFVKQPSQDADAHVCISFATGTFRPVCVFMPGTS